MAEATLSISSRNYSSWSLRGWLLCTMSGLDFETEILSGHDPTARAELLHLSPSFLVPRLIHGEVKVWDTLAIAAYLDEIRPEAGLLPADVATRAWCRAISGEMHQGFMNLRSALPMNLKSVHPGFKVWGGAVLDVERVAAIWEACLARHGGPWLFGERATLAGRDVRARLHALCDLRCRAVGRLRGLPGSRHGLADPSGVDRRRPGRT